MLSWTSTNMLLLPVLLISSGFSFCDHFSFPSLASARISVWYQGFSNASCRLDVLAPSFLSFLVNRAAHLNTCSSLCPFFFKFRVVSFHVFRSLISDHGCWFPLELCHRHVWLLAVAWYYLCIPPLVVGLRFSWISRHYIFQNGASLSIWILIWPTLIFFFG